MTNKNSWLQHALLTLVGSTWALSTGNYPLFYGVWLIHLMLIGFSKRREWALYNASLLPNLVTYLRITIIIVLALVFKEVDPFIAALIAWTAALMDVADGLMAKRLKGQTRFGAQLDEEADAGYVLLLSMLLFQSGTLPWWIMLAGIPRYAVYILRLSHQEKLQTALFVPGARWIAGISFTLFPTLLFLPGNIKVIIGAIIVVGLLYSLTLETYLYVKNKSDLHNL